LGRAWPGWTRRELLQVLSAAALCPRASAAQPRGPLLAAAWQSGTEQHLGLLTIENGRLEPATSLKLPTRAHGVQVEPDGNILAFARRPGDWLLRWHPSTGRTQWHWLEDDRRLNGHGVQIGSRLIVTTETDRETGQGWLGVRDRKSLELVDAWPTQGRDPHQVLLLPHALGRWPAGTLIVANGGVNTRSETGRNKTFGTRLDASLVALDPKNGRLLGQWRLSDPYLSIRHLASSPKGGTLGIALQAEHPDEAVRSAAPVLATWEGDRLTLTSNQPALGGYGGDIVALPSDHQGGFAVGCTRADSLAFFTVDGRFVQAVNHAQACALACAGDNWWNAGQDGALTDRWTSNMPSSSTGMRLPVALDLQIDNHWQLYI
jgi:hypothetical protein